MLIDVIFWVGITSALAAGSGVATFIVAGFTAIAVGLLPTTEERRSLGEVLLQIGVWSTRTAACSIVIFILTLAFMTWVV